MEFVVGIFVVLLLVCGGFAAAKYEKNRVWSAWREFADDRGFVSMAPGMFGELEMSGTERDVPVHLRTETRRNGDDHLTYTVFRAELPNGVPDDLS